jgi:hypothetical protein
MQRFYFTLVLSMCIFSLAAQDSLPRSTKKDQRYWFFGPGLSIQNMYDEGISYVRYHGVGVSPLLGLLKTSDKKYRQFTIQPSFVTLKTDRSNDLRPMKVATTRIMLDYLYLLKVKERDNEFDLWVGGDLSLLFNLKTAPQLDNSQLVYDYALSIGPGGKLDKGVHWNKRDCYFSWQLTLPLLSHIARPYYLNRIEFIDPENNFIGDLFSNSQVVTANKHFRITSGLSFTYPIFNKNFLRLGYSWDYYNTKTINKVHAAEHLISIAFHSNY